MVVIRRWCHGNCRKVTDTGNTHKSFPKQFNLRCTDLRVLHPSLIDHFKVLLDYAVDDLLPSPISKAVLFLVVFREPLQTIDVVLFFSQSWYFFLVAQWIRLPWPYVRIHLLYFLRFKVNHLRHRYEIHKNVLHLNLGCLIRFVGLIPVVVYVIDHAHKVLQIFISSIIFLDLPHRAKTLQVQDSVESKCFDYITGLRYDVWLIHRVLAQETVAQILYLTLTKFDSSFLLLVYWSTYSLCFCNLRVK